MSNYQSPSDFKYVTTLLNYAPKETQAFIDFDHSSVKRSEGHIPVKIRELIALKFIVRVLSAQVQAKKS